MNESRLTSRGQVTIPRGSREALDLHEGDRVAFVPDGAVILVYPIKGNVLNLKGIAKKKHRGGPIDFKRMRERLWEQWAVERVDAWKQKP